jgi:molecular chaperone GrpE
MSTENENAEDESTVDETLADAVAEAADAIAEEAGSAETPDGYAGESTDVEAERDQYFDQWKRTQAELENFRKRAQRELELALRYANVPLIRELLPAMDNLSRSVQAAEQTGNVEELLQGLRMIQSQFDQVFSNQSAQPIKTVGEPFDPNLHEALQQIPTDEHPPMTVLQEVERGYVLHDRVIRPSKVLVSTTLPQPAAEGDEVE